MRARTLLAAVVAVLLAIAGCGSSPEDDPNADLRARARLVSAAVDARDAESARSALNGLREALATHRANGDIDPEKAAAIAMAADYVEEHLAELDAPPEDEEAPDDDGAPEEEEEATPEEQATGDGDDGDRDDDDDDDASAEQTPPGQNGDPPGQGGGRGRGGG